MSGDIGVRVPGNMDLPAKFFGHFSGRDLLRIGTPAAVMFFLTYPLQSGTDILLIGIGLGIGAALHLIQPFNQPIETTLMTAGQWLAGKRTVRDGVVCTRNHRYIQREDGTCIGVIQVAPTNLSLHGPSEQAALHQSLQQVYDTVTYPIELHSRQRRTTLDDYLDTLDDHKDDMTRAQQRLHDAYTAYCEQVGGDGVIQTEHYVTVMVSRDATDAVAAQISEIDRTLAPITEFTNTLFTKLPIPVDAPFPTPTHEPDTDPEQAGQAKTPAVELDRRCNELTQLLSTGPLDADRVTGQELVEVTGRFHGDIPNLTPQWTATPPTSDDTETDAGEWRQTVAITDYPSQAPVGWPVDLLQVDGLVDVTQVIHPTPSPDAVNTLSRTVERLRAEATSQQAEGFAGTNEYEARTADAEWMLDLLADRETTPVQYGVVVTVHGSTRQECEHTLQYVQNQLQTRQFAAQTPVFRTDDAYRTQSPLHGDGLRETRLMPSSSATAGFPFATTAVITDTGVVYGEDVADGTPILLDRFEWSSHSLARMGMVGSGKSYATKLELMRAWLAYDDLQIYVVDPKQEYRHIVETLGGTMHVLAEDGDQCDLDGNVVGFEVPDRGDDANVDRLTALVQELYRQCSQDDRKTLVVIDEARILLNATEGRHVLNQFVLEARDTNTAVTLVTQNASHFTHSREGREILDNMPGKVFMRHDRVGADVVDYFQLSDRERQELLSLDTGTDSIYSESLIHVSNRVKTKATVRVTAAEHDVITAGGGE